LCCSFPAWTRVGTDTVGFHRYIGNFPSTASQPFIEVTVRNMLLAVVNCHDQHDLVLRSGLLQHNELLRQEDPAQRIENRLLVDLHLGTEDLARRQDREGDQQLLRSVHHVLRIILFQWINQLALTGVKRHTSASSQSTSTKRDRSSSSSYGSQPSDVEPDGDKEDNAGKPVAGRHSLSVNDNASGTAKPTPVTVAPDKSLA
jgi:hypothetical protein